LVGRFVHQSDSIFTRKYQDEIQIELTLADFIVADAALSVAFEAIRTNTHFLMVLGNPPSHSLSPHSKA
jgi:hypothetical protein